MTDGSQTRCCRNCQSSSPIYPDKVVLLPREENPAIFEEAFDCNRLDAVVRASDACACHMKKGDGNGGEENER